MIQTRPRTRWVIQMSLMTVVCAVFGVWGWYDYSVKIPMDELGYQKKVAFSNVKSGLEAHANGEDSALQTAVQAVQAAQQQLTASMTEVEVEQLKSVRRELESPQFIAELKKSQEEGLNPAQFVDRYLSDQKSLGKVARARVLWSRDIDRLLIALIEVGSGRWERGSDDLADFVEFVSTGITNFQKYPVPNKWNRMVQWLFILCGPYAVVAGLQLASGLRKKYSVDEEGNFHHPHGSWAAAEINDIDMSRWMSKSVAKIVHADGRTVVVDDYIHQDADQIIGAIAHRLRPAEWTDDAKAVEANSTSEEINTPNDTSEQD